jgi:hypothetical protein
MHRVFMTEQSGELQITVWAFPAIRFLVIFSTDGVLQGVRSNRVEIVALGTAPSGGYPFSFPINGFVLVQPNCFSTALRAFLFNKYHHHEFFVCSTTPTSRAGLKDSHKKVNFKIYQYTCRKHMMVNGRMKRTDAYEWFYLQ